MKNKHRLIVFLTAALLFVSCGESTQTPEPEITKGTDTASLTSQTEAETKDPHYEPDLEAEDFGGKPFLIMMNDNENVHNTSVPEKETGDVLNDALYRRNTRIEEFCNVDLQQQIYKWSDMGAVENPVLAGEDAFGLVMMMCPNALTWWREGLLIPFDEIPNINLEKGYWDQNMNESISIGGIHYVAEGAFNLDSYDLTFCVLFNKTLSEQFDLENHYSLVKEGKWTYDQFLSEIRLAVSDINGDGKMTIDDQWGYIANPKMVAPDFWIAANVRSVSKDENDLPYLSFTEEKFITVFQKYMSIAHDYNAVHLIEGPDVPDLCKEIFEENRSLFIDMSLFHIESMRAMQADFGILPYPKYEEAQDSYYSRVSYYMPSVIPVTTGDTDMTGYLLELLNAYSYREVLPAYYELSLKGKTSRDEESAEMLDLIFNTRVIDIGDTTLCDVIRDSFILRMMGSDKRDIVSYSEKFLNSINKRLGDYIAD